MTSAARTEPPARRPTRLKHERLAAFIAGSVASCVLCRSRFCCAIFFRWCIPDVTALRALDALAGELGVNPQPFVAFVAGEIDGHNRLVVSARDTWSMFLVPIICFARWEALPQGTEGLPLRRPIIPPEHVRQRVHDLADGAARLGRLQQRRHQVGLRRRQPLDFV